MKITSAYLTNFCRSVKDLDCIKTFLLSNDSQNGLVRLCDKHENPYYYYCIFYICGFPLCARKQCVSYIFGLLHDYE